MRPEEVLDAKGDLLDRLTDDRFAAFMSGMTTAPTIATDDTNMARLEANVGWVRSIMTRACREGHTFTVSHDLGMLVEHAADRLDGTDQIDLRLPPTASGFVNFDRPFPIIDARGATMLAHWLLWMPAETVYGDDRLNIVTEPQSGIALIWLNDMWRGSDKVNDRLRETLTPAGFEEFQRISGRWASVGLEHIVAGQRLGPAMLDPGPQMSAAVLAQDGVEARKGTNPVRLAHALWLLLDQTLHREDAPVSRPFRRRAEKRGMPAKVTVIRLRRQEQLDREPGESDIEWAHRWIVRGYWRWQPVGPNHRRAVEVEPGVFKARVWVNGHVKGPEGLPFKITEKVYSVDR